MSKTDPEERRYKIEWNLMWIRVMGGFPSDIMNEDTAVNNPAIKAVLDCIMVYLYAFIGYKTQDV